MLLFEGEGRDLERPLAILERGVIVVVDPRRDHLEFRVQGCDVGYR